MTTFAIRQVEIIKSQTDQVTKILHLIQHITEEVRNNPHPSFPLVAQANVLFDFALGEMAMYGQMIDRNTQPRIKLIAQEAFRDSFK